MERAEFKEPQSPLQIIEFGQEFSPFKYGVLFDNHRSGLMYSATFLLKDYPGHVILKQYGDGESGFKIVKDEYDKERPWKFGSFGGPSIFRFVPHLQRVTTPAEIKCCFDLSSLGSQSLGELDGTILYFTKWQKKVPSELEGLPLFIDPDISLHLFDESEILAKIKLKFELIK